MNTAQALGIAAAALVMAMDEPLSERAAWARAEISLLAAHSEALSHDMFARAHTNARCAVQRHLELTARWT